MPQRSPSWPRLRRFSPADVACAAVLTALLTGCGGGAPLLHPAHALAPGKVTAGAGVSGNFIVGEGVVKLRYSEPVPPPVEERVRLEGAVRNASFAPGVAPWVGARVGISGSNEAGLTYYGRSVRVDGRHVFGDEKWALSVGAGASAVLSHVKGESAGTISSVEGPTKVDHETTSAGWGVDLPVLVGYRSTASVAQVWLGARGGIERLTGEFAPLGSADVGEGIRYKLDHTVSRYYGGGLVGAAVGFRPFWVALELNVAYQYAHADGDMAGGGSAQVDVSGVSIAPAGAIIGKF